MSLVVEIALLTTEGAAVLGSAIAAGWSYRKSKKDERAAKAILGMVRGNVELQRSLILANKDLVIDQMEINSLVNKMSELDTVALVDKDKQASVKSLLASVADVKHKRFFKKLAEAAEFEELGRSAKIDSHSKL